ncbi:Potassium channel domain [Trypanosoma melophagium]|uniref:Potassium channel domain n=1 Tax=Trypanosoma melophagium TaxID=715481 RepID=UPI00351A1A1D|nr:Potassium channel domain [Trypanosoma melophagium]
MLGNTPTTRGPVFPTEGVNEKLLNEVTDLTAPGHYKFIAQYAPHMRYWRDRDRSQKRLTRRLKAVVNDGEEEESDDDGCRFSRMCSCLFPSLRSGEKKEYNKKEALGFATTSGAKRFFQSIIWEQPMLAMCVWAFLFVCETAMVVLYVLQTTRTFDVSWMHYSERNFSWFAYVQTVLSIVLLSQLFFAYSVSVYTIAVVLLTSGYQIVTFLVAFFAELRWVSRMYVPLFLRCWPMRQYFLFLLDAVAMLRPRNHKLDVIRLSAGPLTYFLAVFFTTGCIFHIHQLFRGQHVNIGVAMYWLMVTISTVGFGDVVPYGPDGRVIAIVIIFFFMAKMPSWIMLVISTMKLLNKFPSYSGRRRHIIVYGHVKYEEAIALLEEVFVVYPMKSVCFCNNNYTPDVKAIGRNPRYRLRSTFLEIRVLDQRTLLRLKVREAAAIIIFPSSGGSTTTRDDDVMLSSVIFQRHAPQVQQFLRLRFGLHVRLLRERNKTVIDQQMKTIMATALLLPGVVPFLVNLVNTSSSHGTSSPTLWKKSEQDNWKELYEYSRRNVFGTHPVPWYFVHIPLSRVIRLMKIHDILIVGVEEGARRLMRLDLEYLLEAEDTLLFLHERGTNTIERALVALEPCENGNNYSHNNTNNSNSGRDGVEPFLSGDAGIRKTFHAVNTYLSPGASQQDLFEFGMDAADSDDDNGKIFYPFNRSFDLNDAEMEGIGHDESPGKFNSSRMETQKIRRKGKKYSPQLDHVRELREKLLSQSFVNKNPCGVPLSELPLGGSLSVLRDLLRCHSCILSDNNSIDQPIGRLEQQINDILTHVAHEYLHGYGASDDPEYFLYIDQVAAFKKPPLQSLYDTYLNKSVSRFELVQMMRCIQAIHDNSRLTVLTVQELSYDFLQWWNRAFGHPLRYIRGLSTLETHLDYALSKGGGITKVRGLLLYSSQLGTWDFDDVPLITVENNIRALLEWASLRQRRDNNGESTELSTSTEQNLVVELQSFKSCVYVTPHHKDEEWRRRGEEQFQYSLAFMMGRCFSTNMLHTIFIHAQRDHRIMQFFEMVLCLRTQTDLFDVNAWCNSRQTSPTLFKVCGNQLLHFQTFGDAFAFLLARRSWVAIGVFRQFPQSEAVQGTPRYFITNPSLDMPLRPDDVMYALVATGATSDAHNTY